MSVEHLWEPIQKIRDLKVKLKLSPIKYLIKGKRVAIVDDSLVRGTTSRQIVKMLKEAGAKEIHMRIASPEIKYPCRYWNRYTNPKRVNIYKIVS